MNKESLTQKGDAQCEVIDTQEDVTTVSDAVVSPAISLVISHANSREQSKTETLCNKSSNQSGSKSVDKPNCYKCKYRDGLNYSAHSRCTHQNGMAEMFLQMQGLSVMGVKGNMHGIKKGWFLFPLDYDPVWLESCNEFTEIL